MRLESLRLHNFRNYADVNVSFTDGIHILTGKNAQGKTNLLESILIYQRPDPIEPVKIKI